MVPSLILAAQSGFMSPDRAIIRGDLPVSGELTRAWASRSPDSQVGANRDELISRIERGEFNEDPGKALAEALKSIGDLERSITSTNTAFPIRENLEAEVIKIPQIDTPIRTLLPRVPGQGSAVRWKQATSLGGGWGTVGDQLGGGVAVQSFFGESGAPGRTSTVYAEKTASYKLLGIMDDITGFAMATGANFQAQYATEKANSIQNLMLIEENALINGDSTSVVAPYGDGTNAFAFDGMVNLITTGNGVPSTQIVTSIGALTTSHLDSQITRLWRNGGNDIVMIMNSQEVLSLVHLLEASGTFYRIVAQNTDNSVNVGFSVANYIHPISGQLVKIVVSRFLAAGTILFWARRGPQNGGANTMEVDVLPQVQLPETAFASGVQGYTAQDLAPAQNAPQVFAWLTSVYEVLKLKNAYMVGKSTGVTAV